MNIPWDKLKALSLSTLDQYSQVAGFLQAHPAYFYTVLKADLLMALSAAFLLALSVLLGISVLGIVLLPLVVLAGVFLLVVFPYSIMIGLTHCLRTNREPSLSAVFDATLLNLGLIPQLSVTALIIGSVFGAASLSCLLVIIVVTIFIPFLNLAGLFTQLAIIPASLMLGFLYIDIILLYLSGKRGWVRLAQKAFEGLWARKEQAYALGLGLSLLTSALPLFFNGGILMPLVALFVTVPLIQCLSVLVPYSFYQGKKA